MHTMEFQEQQAVGALGAFVNGVADTVCNSWFCRRRAQPQGGQESLVPQNAGGGGALTSAGRQTFVRNWHLGSELANENETNCPVCME